MKIIILLISIIYSIDETILINSSSFTDWKYFSFANDKIEEVIIQNPSDSNEWDLGIMRNHFRTNSGKSGNAIGGVIVDSVNVFNNESWDDLNSIYGQVNFSEDGMLNNIYDIVSHTYSSAPGSIVLETWGWFDFDNNYQFNVNNYQYILRTADGSSVVKMWIQDYYNDLGQSAHVTLRYSTDLDCTLDECDVCGGDGSSCSFECSNIGDVNDDGGWNVLDVVALVNCVLLGTCSENENACAADMNTDGGYNVLDVVELVNCVLVGNCG